MKSGLQIQSLRVSWRPDLIWSARSGPRKWVPVTDVAKWHHQPSGSINNSIIVFINKSYSIHTPYLMKVNIKVKYIPVGSWLSEPWLSICGHLDIWSHRHIFRTSGNNTLRSLEFWYRRKQSCWRNDFPKRYIAFLCSTWNLDHDLQRPS